MAPTSLRAHHKSRAGCTTCKSKKVKCDEGQPCSYCVKRQLSCSLAPSSSPSTESGRGSKTPEIRVVQPYEGTSFSFTDFGLYHHFAISTAFAQADDSASASVWRDVVGDLATQYPYLLHEILATAALHQRLALPDQAAYLERVAAEHQAKAIPLFRQALASISAETALPLFACACLFIPYHFAAAKDASSLLFNEEAGTLAEWLILIQGCAAITMEQNATLMHSSLRALLGELYTPKVEDLGNGPTDERLVDLYSKLPITPEQRETYSDTLVRLRVCFYLSDKADSPLDKKNAALRFPSIINNNFRTELAAKHPAALIIMAYWCVLLNRVEDRWWLKDRVKPLLIKIKELIPMQYTTIIEWPLGEVGVYPEPEIGV
ncbi:uncharacterized protein GGS22DRAFT_168104 [Annulohypoxylon maeteangense]|uniref:uncharacterized protein n=1 Tax=Annulohypoxylon maeteangense TaxID=1927788 RepID=UPI0020078E49|nr:uncharacterized protein GGS22DRAFT_168104 [Annulohypoxylon maeteangense]KAI0883200.1 hypothetical protein GGS22DRAFT_168104 [Annulohypoxylon maeteangense]